MGQGRFRVSLLEQKEGPARRPHWRPTPRPRRTNPAAHGHAAADAQIYQALDRRGPEAGRSHALDWTGLAWPSATSSYADGDLVGLSCIAWRSGSLFAEALLDVGGRLNVVLPSKNSRDAKVNPYHAPTFDQLMEAAVEVLVVPCESANREAYEAANKTLLERADGSSRCGTVSRRPERAAARRTSCSPLG
jgi:hypothetical protein